jgi:hypothetical protein
LEPQGSFQLYNEALNRQVGDHLIEIAQVKERWWLGAQRPSFRVTFDGNVVAERD